MSTDQAIMIAEEQQSRLEQQSDVQLTSTVGNSRPMSEVIIDAGESIEDMGPEDRIRKEQHDAFMKRVMAREEKTSSDLMALDNNNNSTNVTNTSS